VALRKLFTIILILASLNCGAKIRLGDDSSKKSNGYICLGSLALAASFNACMDASNDHFNSSIFQNQNPKFWNHAVSWKYAPKVYGYPIDAWHIFKTGMISSLCVPMAIVMHENLPIIKRRPLLDKCLWFIIAGVTWDAVFNTNYNHLLK